MNDSAGILHEFLHLIDYPAICVQLIVLEKCLVFFGLKHRPDVVAETSHSLVEFDLGVLVGAKVRELLRELVERFYEILDQDG